MIAMLGTGTMGAPMARNLKAAGLEVRAFNRTREKADALTADGIEVADSPEEAVRGADIVITMVSDGDAVTAAMEDGGALAAMPDDALWLQMSTVGIAATEALAALAEERSVPFVDAPVLGTKAPAEQGKLQVLASGPDDQRERCAPVFDAVGASTRWLGEAGAGTRAKLVLNSWLLSLTESVAETVAFAESIDVDPRVFLQTIEGGPLDCAYAQTKGGAMIERSFAPSFSLSLARKDAGLVLEAAERHDQPVPIAEVVARQMEKAQDAGHGDEDMAATYWASAGDEGTAFTKA
jgi:3-hydroxyisobutyrate dehydrogenase